MNETFAMKTSHQKNSPIALNTAGQVTIKTHGITSDTALPGE